MEDILHLGSDLVTLPVQGSELRGHAREHESCGTRGGDDDGLLAERGHDRCRPGTAFARRLIDESVPEPLLVRGARNRRRRVVLQQTLATAT